jgi:hypothetical protein
MNVSMEICVEVKDNLKHVRFYVHVSSLEYMAYYLTLMELLCGLVARVPVPALNCHNVVP